MPKLSDIRRIVPEDFSNEDREVAEKISGSYNEFADEVYQLINGNLDFSNLARNKVTVDVTFQADGNPTVPVNIGTTLSSVSMVYIGNVQNMTNSSERLTSAPFIGWTFMGNGLVKLNYGMGFTTGRKYRLTLEIVK
jgi:hypothetical protein